MTEATNRNRVSKGVPQGGEFAAEQRTENEDLPTPVYVAPRERVRAALKAGASGLYARRLKGYLREYAAIKGDGMVARGRRAAVDESVAWEFHRQGRVDEAKADFDNGGHLSDFQRRLCRLHGLQETPVNSDGHQALYRISSPRTGHEITILVPQEIADDDDTEVYDLLHKHLRAAEDSYGMTRPDEWADSRGYTPSAENWREAVAEFEDARESANLIRHLVGEDYPLYVKGEKP